MTIQEYIEDEFKDFGIELSESKIRKIALKGGLNPDDDAEDKIGQVEVAIIHFVPDLLLRHSSFSEGDLSMSWADMEAKIKAWYSLRCSEYELEDKLSDKPTVIFW